MRFSFVHISDHHLRESETMLTRGYSTAYAFRAVMRHIAQKVADRVDFIVTTGDLVDGGTNTEYQQFRRMLGIAEGSHAPGPQRVNIEGLRDMPMYFLPGNHDRREAFYRNLFPLDEPRELMNVAFSHQGIRFVCLDWGPKNKAVAYPETLEFLKRELSKDIPVVLMMHHHAQPVGARWLDDFIADDVEKFREIVHGKNVLGIICGHTHATYEKRVGDIPIYGTRSTTFQFAMTDEMLIVLQPPHYRVVTIEDNWIATEVVQVEL